MAKKNDFLQELIDMGATESQLKELRNIQSIYKEKDIYSKIEKTNNELLGERVKPLTLSYETAVRLIKYNVFSNIQGVLDSYKNAILLVDQGSTQQFEDYTNKLAEELQDIGAYNATPEKLRRTKLDELEFWYSKYRKYELAGHIGGMQYAREKIIELLEMG